jgi:sensor domain CHASE-containing protein
LVLLLLLVVVLLMVLLLLLVSCIQVSKLHHDLEEAIHTNTQLLAEGSAKQVSSSKPPAAMSASAANDEHCQKLWGFAVARVCCQVCDSD